MQFYFGCSGWSNISWQGPLYPKDIENSKWLKFYSNIFTYVETESSFYRIPNEFMVKKRYRGPQRTSDNLGWPLRLGARTITRLGPETNLSNFFRENQEELCSFSIGHDSLNASHIIFSYQLGVEFCRYCVFGI